MVGGGVLCEGDDFSGGDVDNGDLEIVVDVGFKGKPLSIGRPGWGGVVVLGVGDLG